MLHIKISVVVWIVRTELYYNQHYYTARQKKSLKNICFSILVNFSWICILPEIFYTHMVKYYLIIYWWGNTEFYNECRYVGMMDNYQTLFKKYLLWKKKHKNLAVTLSKYWSKSFHSPLKIFFKLLPFNLIYDYYLWL